MPDTSKIAVSVSFPEGEEDSRDSVVVIDSSCAWTVLPLFLASLVWLIVAGVFQLLTQVHLVAPQLLSNFEFLGFGRLQGALTAALEYGFGINGLIGGGIWLQSRLSKTRLKGGAGFHLFGAGWNSFLAIGVASILLGESTGTLGFELPQFAAVPMWVSFVVGGAIFLWNCEARNVRELYPTQWFLISGVVWFGWSLSSALLVRELNSSAIIQYISAQWLNQQVAWFVLGGYTLGVLIYLVPKFSSAQLQDEGLAKFVFWSFVTVVTWGGFSISTPLPAWIIGVSKVSSTLLLVSLVAFVVLMRQSIGDQCDRFRSTGIGKLLGISTIFFAFAVLWQWLLGTTSVARLLDATPAVQAGFVALVLGAAVIVHISLIDHSIGYICGNSRSSGNVPTFAILGVVFAVVGMIASHLGSGLVLSSHFARDVIPTSSAFSAPRFFYSIGLLSAGLYLASLGLVTFSFIRMAIGFFSSCCGSKLCSWMGSGVVKKGVS